MVRQWYLLGAFWCLFGTAWAGQLRCDFNDSSAKLWHLSYGQPGRAAIEKGLLVLDMTAAKSGKWAVALLRRVFSLPATITWRQRLAHNSQYTWYSGLAVESVKFGRREQITAGLGGGGMGNRVFLGDQKSPKGVVKEQNWYLLALRMERARQRLEVRDEATGRVVAALETTRGLVHGPFALRFFQNDPRLGPEFPDAYDQDRGRAEVDWVVIEAPKFAEYTPPKPGTPYPYKVPLVFNRAMRWLTAADGVSRGSIAYDACGWLALTGQRAVSRWLELTRFLTRDLTRFPEQPNIAPQDERRTAFVLPAGKDAAAFALRALQWNLEQHPVMHYRGVGHGVRWRIEVSATDGVHPFAWVLWRSEWTAGAANGQVDLRELYRRGGWPNRYAEMDFVVRLERAEEAGGQRRLALEMGMPGRAAVVPRSYVVAQEQAAREKGVVVEAAVVDDGGRLVDDAEVTAAVAGRRVVLSRRPGKSVYSGAVRGLGPGQYKCVFVARRNGETLARAESEIEVTAMEFADHYDRRLRSYCTTSGRALGPLLGDLLAWVPMADLATAQRRVLCGLAELNAAKERGQKVGYTKWRVLPRPMIERYVDYMARCGCRLLRLTVNVSPAEYYLDVCGHVAPHGLEQVSYIAAAARRRGLRCVLNLTHYPYLWPGTGMNPPVLQYFEAGYKRRFEWTSDEMWRHLSSYLAELTGFTGQDPAVMAYTVTGENDQRYGPEWINRAYDLLKRAAPRQMVVLEQGGSIKHCLNRDPASYSDFKPASDGGVGYRTYATYKYPTDCFIAVAARFYNMARPSFLGEVACGVNTWPWFRLKLRDAMGIALALQQPMAISWSAALVECERRALTKAAEMVDWSAFVRAKAPVAVIVDRPDDAQIERMVEYEQALASAAVDYEFVRPGDEVTDYKVVFDARRPFDQAAVREAAARLGDMVPLSVSPGNHVTYALSEDRRWLVAYIRNAMHYEMKVCDVGRVVEKCRMGDVSRELTIRLKRLAEGLEYAVIDTGTAKVVARGDFAGSASVRLGETTSDFVLVVRPAGR